MHALRVFALLTVVAFSAISSQAEELIVDDDNTNNGTGSFFEVDPNTSWALSSTECVPNCPGRYFGNHYGGHATSAVYSGGEGSAHWNVSVGDPSGMYDVFARWEANPNRATDAEFVVEYGAGSTSSPILRDMTQNSAEWVLLGRFQNPTRVSLSNSANSQTTESGYIIADAVRVVSVSDYDGEAYIPTMRLRGGSVTTQKYSDLVLSNVSDCTVEAEVVLHDSNGNLFLDDGDCDNGSLWVWNRSNGVGECTEQAAGGAQKSTQVTIGAHQLVQVSVGPVTAAHEDDELLSGNVRYRFTDGSCTGSALVGSVLQFFYRTTVTPKQESRTSYTINGGMPF